MRTSYNVDCFSKRYFTQPKSDLRLRKLFTLLNAVSLFQGLFIAYMVVSDEESDEYLTDIRLSYAAGNNSGASNKLEPKQHKENLTGCKVSRQILQSSILVASVERVFSG